VQLAGASNQREQQVMHNKPREAAYRVAHENKFKKSRAKLESTFYPTQLSCALYTTAGSTCGVHSLCFPVLSLPRPSLSRQGARFRYTGRSGHVIVTKTAHIVSHTDKCPAGQKMFLRNVNCRDMLGLARRG